MSAGREKKNKIQCPECGQMVTLFFYSDPAKDEGHLEDCAVYKYLKNRLKNAPDQP